MSTEGYIASGDVRLYGLDGTEGTGSIVRINGQRIELTPEQVANLDGSALGYHFAYEWNTRQPDKIVAMTMFEADDLVDERSYTDGIAPVGFRDTRDYYRFEGGEYVSFKSVVDCNEGWVEIGGAVTRISHRITSEYVCGELVYSEEPLPFAA
jgi:hypothetical protein